MDDRQRTSRRRPPPDRARWSGPRRVLIALVAVLVALGLAASALAFVGDPHGHAPGAVEVGGVPVGGLDEAAVAELARRRAGALTARPLVISVSDAAARFETSRAGLGARPQVRRAVETALAPRSPWERLSARLGGGSTREVPLRFTLDDDAVEALVGRVAESLNEPPRSAAVRLGDSGVDVIPGAGGFGVDPERLRERIGALPERIELRRTPLRPPVDDAAARRAARLAERVLGASVEVTVEGRRELVGAEALRAALRFTPRGPAIQVRLHPPALRDALGAALDAGERPARDAAFAVAGSQLSLVPSEPGRELDTERLAAQIVSRVRNAPGPEPATVRVPARLATVAPERTTAELEALRIEEQVSMFSTSYECCPPRVTNIQRAAEILDGTIIPPGGRFSLNEAMGQRTEERGFVAAPQIAAGRLEDAVGGGVSQIATTIYNAAFFAGLDVVSHTPHEFYISRYPPGREATVSFGGPELVFVNDWEAGVLIDAKATSNAVTFRFFSSALGRRVETETGEPTEYVEPTVNETVNPDLAPGERVVRQSAGGAGFTVGYTRQVFQGEDLRRDEAYTWSYRPQNGFVEMGPAAPEPEPKDAEPEPDVEPEPKDAEPEDGETEPAPDGEQPDPPAETTPAEPGATDGAGPSSG